MKMMKPYFCPKCGKAYSQKDCLINDGKMYCYDCPKTKLAFTGGPLMLIGAFLGVLFISLQLNHTVQAIQYSKWAVLLAACGFVFTGILRNQQAYNARKHAQNNSTQAEPEEKQGPISAE